MQRVAKISKHSTPHIYRQLQLKDSDQLEKEVTRSVKGFKSTALVSLLLFQLISSVSVLFHIGQHRWGWPTTLKAFPNFFNVWQSLGDNYFRLTKVEMTKTQFISSPHHLIQYIKSVHIKCKIHSLIFIIRYSHFKY